MKSEHMKTISSAAIIGLFALLLSGEVKAQAETREQELNAVSAENDLETTVQIAKTIENVNRTDPYDRSLLMYSSAKGYSQAVRILLGRGADPDLQAIDGLTALMYASYNGSTRIVKMLLEKGANVNLQALDGLNALMMASQNGYTEIVKLLLENGANPNLQAFDGYTSVIVAQ